MTFDLYHRYSLQAKVLFIFILVNQLHASVIVKDNNYVFG